MYVWYSALLLSLCNSPIYPHEQTQLLDDCIETVVVRVEEFKQQLDVMHKNITSSSNKMEELHEKTQQLTELFQRIDQIEVGYITPVYE